MSAHTLQMDSRHRYRCVTPDHVTEPCHGVVFQSVTTILGNSVPKNLAWHGQTRGVIGVKGLMRKQYDVARMSVPDITDALKREKLTVNHHRDEAAGGGTIVHKALEDYAEKGALPIASAVPENKRGSIQGLAKFIVEYRPEIVAAEVRTLSVKHGYAGTFDLLCRIRARREDGKLVADPNAEPLFVLADLKTSKWVYPASHFPQLEAYEGARVEMGEPPTDVRAVIWTNPDGDMQLVPSSASFEDFLALKASADVIKRLDSTWKRPRKAKA